MNKESELLISFDDRSPEFVDGVEFGRVLQKLEYKIEEEINNNGFPIRLSNQELVYRACEIYGYEAIFSECHVSGWVNFTGVKNNY